MLGNIRYYTQVVSIILLIIFVFMNFLGHWSADRFVQIMFFFSMIFAVYGVGMETEKKLKTEADWNRLKNILSSNYPYICSIILRNRGQHLHPHHYK